MFLFPQLASVILKQYVETHWCAQSEKFRPPETTDRVRTGMRDETGSAFKSMFDFVPSDGRKHVSVVHEYIQY